MNILNCSNVCYGSNNSSFVIKKVSLALNEGETLGFLGKNGAGKTTVMRIILNVLPPSSGQVDFFGGPLRRDTFSSVGVFIERGTIYPHLSVKENLLIHCGLRGLSGNCALDVMREVNIDFGSKVVRTVSAGMRQKLGLAIALLGRPRLLILDEPLTGLDPAVIDESLALLRKFAANGGAILFSSHQLSDVQRIASSICVIDMGAITYSSSMRELANNSALVMRCSDPIRAIEVLRLAGFDALIHSSLVHISSTKNVDIVGMMVSAGIVVDEVQREPLLEQFFTSKERAL